jgi:hypothetical protein
MTGAVGRVVYPASGREDAPGRPETLLGSFSLLFFSFLFSFIDR